MVIAHFVLELNFILRQDSKNAGYLFVLKCEVHGGIPEYVKSGMGVILNNLMDDILIRDIAIRHSIRDVNSLRQLAVYLISNIGNLVSANKLEGMYGIKSSSTILEYFSYLKDSYLLEFIPQFNYSLKAQARNPKKIYAMLLKDVSIESCSTA